MSEEKITLTEADWELLLPGEEYVIGKSKIFIKPLGLEALAKVLDALHKLLDDWKDILLAGEKIKKIKRSMTEEILLFFPKVSSLIQVHGIHIISDMSGIAKDDVKRLPPNIAVGLFDKCLSINIKSQEGLEKNLKALSDQVVQILSNRGANSEE